MRYSVEEAGRTLHFSMTRASIAQADKSMALGKIEEAVKDLVLTVQDYSLFAHRAVMNLFRPPRYWPEFLIQSDVIGVGSTSIVMLSGFFTGGVLALQSAATLSEFGAAAVTGRFVSITMCLDHHDSRARACADRHHGRGAQCLVHGKRAGIHGGHGTD
jgi:hypothetical protein